MVGGGWGMGKGRHGGGVVGGQEGGGRGAGVVVGGGGANWDSFCGCYSLRR